MERADRGGLRQRLRLEALARRRRCARWPCSSCAIRCSSNSRRPPVFQLVLDPDTRLAQALIEDRRAALISFTGSTAVGRQVAQSVAARLGKALLELGGNGAVIVDDSADLDMAARAIVFGALGTAGQRCTTTRRVFVNARAARGAAAASGACLSAGAHRRSTRPDHAGRSADRCEGGAAFEQALAAVRSAGGRCWSAAECSTDPAITSSRRSYWRAMSGTCVQHETFGPILYLIPVDSLEQAIEQQNATAYGLSSGLFTRRLDAAELYLSHRGSDCGIANVNLGTSGAEIGGAFGGEKDTGGGREAGSDAWKAYMRRQTNTINWGSTLPLAQGIEFEVPP